MSYPLYVAFIWHQHQPLYKSHLLNHDSDGQYRLPWVRLHGTKDYLDLVLILEQYPRLHQTVNLVPSLMLQLEEYASGKAIDPHLALTLSSVSQISKKEKEYIIEYFFDANHYHMIRPHHRYDELYQQKHDQGLHWCLDHWQEQDYSDLLAWHNLAWFDPLFWSDHEIANWLEKGRNFTLKDRRNIYAKQKEIIRKIIPQHKKMQDKGQLEITTTPYSHPIMPLLADSHAARVALPTMNLPKQRIQWEEDIPRHLNKAWKMYLDRFNQAPKGLWPSEQSVSPTILPHVAKRGFKWLCSDEAVLGWSLRHFFHRDETGNVNEPEYLYRPYRLPTEHGDLSIIFRDHRLSDLIAFSYGSMNPEKAAGDLIGHLEAIARKLKQNQEYNEQLLENPWLVTIALDGENCWEFYEQDGKLFLESLYKRLAHQSQIELVTVSEFLEQFPPTKTLDPHHFHSGSWIDGNFTTWIGDPIKNKAWDYLQAARLILAMHPEATEETNPKAWEALYAAQGSDWFWWFGDPHHSHHDAMFDQLFREHLIALYQALDESVPEYLYAPITEFQPVEDHDHIPGSFIHPMIDGNGEEVDWEQAGQIKNGGHRGTMHKTSIIPQIFYGYDHLNFYLRFDLQPGVNLDEDLPGELHLVWYYCDRPGFNNTIPLANVPDHAPLNYYYRHHLGINLVTQTCWLEEAQAEGHWYSRYCNANLAIDKCIELAVPWGDLHVDPDCEVNLVTILADNGQFKEHFPENKVIRLRVP